MFMRSGFSGLACEQFHRHAPQWTHFSRSKAGTPVSPGVIAWPLHASMQMRALHFSQT